MKQTVTRKILTEASNQIAGKYGRDAYSSSFEEMIIPDKKTETWYESALDAAVRTYFLYGSDDDLLSILKDAKSNKRLPRKYSSLSTDNFSTYGILIREATMRYEKERGAVAKLYIGFGSVTVFSDSVKISKRISITDNLGKITKSVMETLQKIEKLIQ